MTARKAAVTPDPEVAPIDMETATDNVVIPPDLDTNNDGIVEDYEGQFYVGEHYFITTSNDQFGKRLSVTPKGWVGDSPLTIPVDRVAELIELLGKVKH